MPPKSSAATASAPRHSKRISCIFLLLLAGGLAIFSLLSADLSTNNNDRNFAASDILVGAEQPWFSSSVRFCEPKGIGALGQSGFLKSQGGEDRIALKWFNGLCGGTYLEMGAVDGVSFSNTFVFQKAFGWKGLLVELAPPNFEKLVVNRPDDVTVNAAVCDKPRTLHYWYNPERKFTAGVWEFTQPDFRGRFWSGVRLEDTTPIECVPLDQIIKERFSHGRSQFFDFWSLDVEGSEMMVIKSVDFTTTAFGIIVVEADGTNERKNLALRLFLESKGYRFLQQEKNNYWFVNKNFAEIYAHVLHAGDTKTS